MEKMDGLLLALEENKRSKIALTALSEHGTTYDIVLADDLSEHVRKRYSQLVASGLDASCSNVRRVSKRQVCTGKLFDPYDVRAEVVHHVQWKYCERSSYFSHKFDESSRSATKLTEHTGGPRAPMSAFHLLAQVRLVEYINAGFQVEFVLKCSESTHLVPIFRTGVGMRAQKEVYVPKSVHQSARRLDVAIENCNGEVVFNVEVLHSSRTAEGKRDGRWCEVIATYIIERIQQNSGSSLRIVCEPRPDLYIHCDFLHKEGALWTCDRCAQAKACLRIEAALRHYFQRRVRRTQLATEVVCMWKERVRREKERSERIDAIVLRFLRCLRAMVDLRRRRIATEVVCRWKERVRREKERSKRIDAIVLRFLRCLRAMVELRRRRIATEVVCRWKERVRREKERSKRIDAIVLRFLRCLVHTHRQIVYERHMDDISRDHAEQSRKESMQKRQRQKDKQSERISGINSKAKINRGMTERQLKKQRAAALNMFDPRRYT